MPVQTTTTYTAIRGAAVDLPTRARMLDLWVRVVNAGGAVGFLAPVTSAAVQPVLDAQLRRVEEGDCALVRFEVGDEPCAGFAFLEPPPKTYMRHWATVTCLQLDPDLQGRGLGRALVAAVHDAARAEGLEQLHLTARGGLGLEEFYARCGYVEVGRYPRAIRVAPGDDRDEVLLFRQL